MIIEKNRVVLIWLCWVFAPGCALARRIAQRIKEFEGTVPVGELTSHCRDDLSAKQDQPIVSPLSSPSRSGERRSS